jgi:hypothetical protein
MSSPPPISSLRLSLSGSFAVNAGAPSVCDPSLKMAASGGTGSGGTSTTNFPDELIIRHVRDHSCLYDPRETEYKDADRKAAVWREIANNVGMSGKPIPNVTQPLCVCVCVPACKPSQFFFFFFRWLLPAAAHVHRNYVPPPLFPPVR